MSVRTVIEVYSAVGAILAAYMAGALTFVHIRQDRMTAASFRKLNVQSIVILATAILIMVGTSAAYFVLG